MLLQVDYSALTLKMAYKALPQGKLLTQANVSQSVIRQIQSGKPIKPVTLGKIARVLDCDPAEIATPVSPLREAARVIQDKQHSPLQAAADALTDH